jgi:hypothetical protein
MGPYDGSDGLTGAGIAFSTAVASAARSTLGNLRVPVLLPDMARCRMLHRSGAKSSRDTQQFFRRGLFSVQPSAICYRMSAQYAVTLGYGGKGGR